MCVPEAKEREKRGRKLTWLVNDVQVRIVHYYLAAVIVE
jgi:hypothetical protein